MSQDGDAMFRHACRLALKASSKRVDSRYKSGRCLGEGQKPGLGAAMTMASEHLPPQLEGCVSVVRQGLDKITAASTNPDLDLRNFRAVLTHLLEIVEQDPTIDAAWTTLQTRPLPT